MWYRYQKCTGAPLHVGTGTCKCGTCTVASAITHLHRSTTRGFSTAVAINRDDLHLFSGHEPLQKCARNSKNLHKHKNARNDQRHPSLHKMRAKHELGVLKSYINVALLCIQHRAWLHAMKAVTSTYHLKISYLTASKQVDLQGSQLAARQCYQLSM